MAPENQSFWDNFAVHLEEFKNECKGLNEEALMRMTERPSSNKTWNIFILSERVKNYYFSHVFSEER